MALLTRVMRSIFLVAVFSAILPPLPEGSSSLHGFATAGSFFFRRFELIQGIECGFHHIQHIGAAQRFGQNIMDTGCFQNGAHAASSDNAVPGEAGLSSTRAPATRPITSCGMVVPDQRQLCAYFCERVRLLCAWHRVRHWLCQCPANFAVVIANHNSHAELEAAAAFYHFGHTGDFDDTLVKLLFYTVDNSISIVRPLSLLLIA